MKPIDEFDSSVERLFEDLVAAADLLCKSEGLSLYLTHSVSFTVFSVPGAVRVGVSVNEYERIAS